MYVPSDFFRIKTLYPRLTRRAAMVTDKSETNPDSTQQEVLVTSVIDDKRDGQDRRKRNIKPLLDTRSGRDRRFNKAQTPISIKV